MRILVETRSGSVTVAAKDVYQEILVRIAIACSWGERRVTIYFLDDDFAFGHVKPIVEKLSKHTWFKICAEGSALIRTHITIEY